MTEQATPAETFAQAMERHGGFSPPEPPVASANATSPDRAEPAAAEPAAAAKTKPAKPAGATRVDRMANR